MEENCNDVPLSILVGLIDEEISLSAFRIHTSSYLVVSLGDRLLCQECG